MNARLKKSLGGAMKDASLQALWFVFLITAIYYAAQMFDYRGYAKDKMITALERQGIIVASMNMDVITPMGMEATQVEIVKPWRASVKRLSLDILRGIIMLEKLELPQALGEHPLTLDVRLEMQPFGDEMRMKTDITGSPHSIMIQGHLKANPGKTDQNMFHLDYGSMDVAGGTMLFPTMDMPMGVNKTYVIPVKFIDLSLEKMLQLMAHPSASATGNMSGVFALFLSPDAPLAFGKGRLEATGMGEVRVPPSVFPPVNQQMIHTANMLKHFNYEEIKLTTREKAGRQLLKLSFEGRPIYTAPDAELTKLNVNLPFDMLSFVFLSTQKIPTTTDQANAEN